LSKLERTMTTATKRTYPAILELISDACRRVPNTSIPGPSTATATQEDADEDDLGGTPRPSTAPAALLALQTTSPTLGRGKRKKTETTRLPRGRRVWLDSGEERKGEGQALGQWQGYSNDDVLRHRRFSICSQSKKLPTGA
jgi:Zn-finger nucleic acid-binding protein